MWSTYHKQTMERLRKHPDYKKTSTSELKKLAKKLVDGKEMEEYFSDIIHMQMVEYHVVKPEDATIKLADIEVTAADSTDHDTSVKQPAISINQGACAPPPPLSSLDMLSCRVKDLSTKTFPVKLYLTAPINDPTEVEGNFFASMLESQFGPRAASLQVGGTILEWTPYNLVIPHHNIPTEAAFSTEITQVASKLKEKVRERRGYQESVTGEVDLMLEVSKSVYDMVKTIIKVVVSWNRFYCYEVYGRNSLDFVQNVLTALGIEEPLQNPHLNDYRERLRADTNRAGRTTHFQDHASLDSYVQEKLDGLRTSDMEFLLTEYYRFHRMAKESRSAQAESWTCDKVNCQMRSLEQKIRKEEMLITSMCQSTNQ